MHRWRLWLGLALVAWVTMAFVWMWRAVQVSVQPTGTPTLRQRLSGRLTRQSVVQPSPADAPWSRVEPAVPTTDATWVRS
jgi:hypothetical protein